MRSRQIRNFATLNLAVMKGPDLLPWCHERDCFIQNLHVANTGLVLPVSTSLTGAHEWRIYIDANILCGTTTYVAHYQVRKLKTSTTGLNRYSQVRAKFFALG